MDNLPDLRIDAIGQLDRPFSIELLRRLANSVSISSDPTRSSAESRALPGPLLAS
jgi:hypothetical protein